MTEPNRLGIFKFGLVILGCTILVVAITVGLAMAATSPPRTFMFWVVTGFFVFIESLAGLLTLNLFSRSRSAYRPSGASVTAAFSALSAFAVFGFISIFVYQAVRKEDGSGDGVFSAILAVEATLFFVAALLIYSFDLFLQGQMEPGTARRRERQELGHDIRELLGALRGCGVGDGNLRVRLEQIKKKLSAHQTTLDHAAGGIGSWESPRSGSAENDKLQSAISELTDSVHGFCKSQTPETLTLLESQERRLGSLLTRLEEV